MPCKGPIGFLREGTSRSSGACHGRGTGLRTGAGPRGKGVDILSRMYCSVICLTPHLLLPGREMGNALPHSRELADALPYRSEIERYRFKLLLIGSRRGGRDRVGCGLRREPAKPRKRTAIISLAASPWDCQANAASTPMQNVIRGRAKARVVIGDRLFGNRSFLRSAG
jgi:hypothetical protein